MFKEMEKLSAERVIRKTNLTEDGESITILYVQKYDETEVRRKLYKTKSGMYFNFFTDIYSVQLQEIEEDGSKRIIPRINKIGNYRDKGSFEKAVDEYENETKMVEPEKEVILPLESKKVVHPEYFTIMECVKNDVPVYLVGPAGSGKNFTLQDIAAELMLNFYFTNSIQQEYKLTGFIDANGTFHETEFYKAFTNGGLFFLDELDASIPEVLVLINAAIANRYFEFPTGKVSAHEDFRVVAAGNTAGAGADDIYTGRLRLDASTMDRFVFIEFDYDINIERMLSNGNETLVLFVRELRSYSQELGVHAVFSYRCIITMTKLESILGTEKAIKLSIAKGIDKDTLSILSKKFTSKSKYSQAFEKAAS